MHAAVTPARGPAAEGAPQATADDHAGHATPYPGGSSTTAVVSEQSASGSAAHVRRDTGKGAETE